MEDRTVDIGQQGVTLREIISAHGPSARIILKDGQRVVGRIVLRPEEPRPKPEKRIIGLHRGNVTYMADDFDDPLPEEFWSGDEP